MKFRLSQEKEQDFIAELGERCCAGCENACRCWVEFADDTYDAFSKLEQTLAGLGFVRISNSEIVNLKKVRGFDLSFAGTICVSLSDGSATYVSRRYVAKIKQVLGI